MSLILDALRKIELERKAKRQNSQEIRTEVLNYRGITPVADKSRNGLTMASLLLVSVSVACIFYFMNTDKPIIVPVPQREPLKQDSTPITPPQPEPPVQVQTHKEVKSPAIPVKQLPAPVTVKQKNGEESITVSGIAWQDERSLRRAVINGFLVGEGAEILGAKIVEIKEGRVLFSRGTEFFEVVHSSGSGK